jgi:hypothetical protein
MALKLEEAQKKERAASKDASKATKRADTADEEASRCRCTIGGRVVLLFPLLRLRRF